MIAKPANKHQLKTMETRESLLQAAETIFVRDGYESADLGEVASLAGRTTGAIYAHFKSKEDIFLALIEAKRTQRREEAERALAESSTIEGNIAALRKFYLKVTEDEKWHMLLLEFKLFALRHPDSQKRLQSLIAESLSPRDEERIAKILGKATKRKNTVSRVIAIQTMHSILSALALESKLDPLLLKQDALKTVVGKIFDALLETPPR